MRGRGSGRLPDNRQPATFSKVLEEDQGNHVTRVHQHRGSALYPLTLVSCNSVRSRREFRGHGRPRHTYTSCRIEAPQWKHPASEILRLSRIATTENPR